MVTSRTDKLQSRQTPSLISHLCFLVSCKPVVICSVQYLQVVFPVPQAHQSIFKRHTACSPYVGEYIVTYFRILFQNCVETAEQTECLSPKGSTSRSATSEPACRTSSPQVFLWETERKRELKQRHKNMQPLALIYYNYP